MPSKFSPQRPPLLKNPASAFVHVVAFLYLVNLILLCAAVSTLTWNYYSWSLDRSGVGDHEGVFDSFSYPKKHMTIK